MCRVWSTVSRKAQSGPVPLIVVSDTLGGRGLDYWADNGQLRRLIAEVPWNVVVLQERSVTASLPPSDRVRYMDSPLRRLAGEVRARGAQTVLFMTWAHEHGVFSGIVTGPCRIALLLRTRRRARDRRARGSRRRGMGSCARAGALPRPLGRRRHARERQGRLPRSLRALRDGHRPLAGRRPLHRRHRRSPHRG